MDTRFYSQIRAFGARPCRVSARAASPIARLIGCALSLTVFNLRRLTGWPRFDALLGAVHDPHVRVQVSGTNGQKKARA